MLVFTIIQKLAASMFPVKSADIRVSFVTAFDVTGDVVTELSYM